MLLTTHFCNNVEVVKVLVNPELMSKKNDFYGEIPLFTCKSSKAAEIFIGAVADFNSINNYGDNADMITLLIEKGIDFSIKNKEGKLLFYISQ